MTDISVGSVSVDVVPDASQFAERLRAKISGLTAVIQTRLDDTGIREQLDAISRDQTVDIRANLNDADAKARLDMLTRPRSVNVGVDNNGLASAASNAGRLASGLFSIAGAASILGPALVPVVGAIAGLGAALAAPALAAGGGLGVFGVIGGFAIAKAHKDLQTITELNKKIAEATTGATRRKYQQELANFEKNMAPAEAHLVTAIGTLKATFDKLLKRNSGVVIGPMVQGIKILADILPKLTPILRTFGNVFGDILTRIGKLTDSRAFDRLVHFFAHTGSQAFREFAGALINIGVGITGLAEAFAPLGLHLGRTFEQMTRKFAEFGRHAASDKGVQAFIGYIEKEGPKVWRLLGEIVTLAGRIVTALAPLGEAILPILDKVFGFLDRIPKEILAPLAAALIGLFAGPEVAAVAGGIALFKQLYDHSKDFRDIVNQIGTWIRTKLWPALQHAAKDLMPTLERAVKRLGQIFHENKPLIMTTLRGLETVLVKGVIPAVEKLAKYGLPLLIDALQAVGLQDRIVANAFLIQIRVLVDGYNAFLKVVLWVYGKILDGATAAFGWMPGIGPKLKAADGWFHEFADKTTGYLDRVSARLQHIQDQLNGIHGKTITLDIVTRTHAGSKVAHQLGVPVGATGGIVRRPTLALIGEAGPEAVVPLNRTPGNGPLPQGGFGARQVALTITNWHTGQGYMRELASNEYVANRNYDHVTGAR